MNSQVLPVVEAVALKIILKIALRKFRFKEEFVWHNPKGLYFPV